MTPQSPHVLDDLQRRLDGQLDQAGVNRVEAHLAECALCRLAARELDAVRSAVKRMPVPDAPSDLPIHVSTRIAVDARSRRTRRFATAAMAAGLAAAALIAVTLWVRADRTLPLAAARMVASIEDGSLELEQQTGAAAQLEAHFASRGLPVRVLDLAMMNLALQGGTLVRLDGRPAALYVYRRPDGALVVCQMFRGAAAELPAPVKRLESGGFEFLIYRDGSRTLVVWAEGEILCVLGSSLPEAEVIALARAKAMKPA